MEVNKETIELFTTHNWMIAKVEEDDYRFAAYIESTNSRVTWNLNDDQQLGCTYAELDELHQLIGSILEGIPGQIYPPQ